MSGTSIRPVRAIQVKCCDVASTSPAIHAARGRPRERRNAWTNITVNQPVIAAGRRTAHASNRAAGDAGTERDEPVVERRLLILGLAIVKSKNAPRAVV